MSDALSRFTKSAISLGLVLGLATGAAADVNVEILRQQILVNGLVPVDGAAELSDLAEVGGLIFESKALSLNGNISCQQCHLDEFGSADGIPISVGVSGVGTGAERIGSAYRFLGRNALPLWGRGADDFPTFFWDGRVDIATGVLVSQFGDEPPALDPLVVAVHLPPVETVEMLEFDRVVDRHRTETVDGAMGLYDAIALNLAQEEPELVSTLADTLGKRSSDIGFLDIARGLAAFIRERFAIRETKLHRFAFDGGILTDEELLGGLIFYGKGRCSVCHSGPHFSDFGFHTVPFPQLGQGRNGFGIDYGRFNITHDPVDLYKFRTPPLWDVGDTAPYGHSGSVATLTQAIRAHFDPLGLFKITNMDALQRHEFYKYLMASEPNMLSISHLEAHEIEALARFLQTLDQPGEATR